MTKTRQQQLRKLEQQARDLVRSRAPASQEAIEHATRVQKWSDNTPRVVREAKALAEKGKAKEASALLDNHYGSRPRRRPGRPALAMPPPGKVTRLLREQIFDLGLDVLTNDERKSRHVIESVATAALDFS